MGTRTKKIATVAFWFALTALALLIVTYGLTAESSSTTEESAHPCDETVEMSDGTQEQLAVPGCEEYYRQKLES